MSGPEASALYQGGVLNAKNLVAATLDAVAAALRLNVPFRSRRGGVKGKQGRLSNPCPGHHSSPVRFRPCPWTRSVLESRRVVPASDGQADALERMPSWASRMGCRARHGLYRAAVRLRAVAAATAVSV